MLPPMASQPIPEMECDTALERLRAGQTVFVDIRDAGSFRAGRIPGALNVGDHNVRQFLDDTERTTPLVVVCYHGYSSQSAAAWLLQQGFEQVHSLSGGFTGWALRFPDSTERGA